MSDNHMNGSKETTLDAELRSLTAEMRMDEILAGIGCGDTAIFAGDFSLTFTSGGEDERAEREVL